MRQSKAKHRNWGQSLACAICWTGKERQRLCTCLFSRGSSLSLKRLPHRSSVKNCNVFLSGFLQRKPWLSLVNISQGRKVRTRRSRRKRRKRAEEKENKPVEEIHTIVNVINLTNDPIDDDTTSLLSRGLNYGLYEDFNPTVFEIDLERSIRNINLKKLFVNKPATERIWHPGEIPATIGTMGLIPTGFSDIKKECIAMLTSEFEEKEDTTQESISLAFSK
ncbi:uncharacterized protein LOC130275334 [Hyla sarda]|uniref:uncharacterized protein LOC130275334 n=1 Tax=Hyla sarda TaxID=327740 RepID=UPI0024C3FF8D|nr:uncharacterized protein LOC130275334 [Hyla sarda]